MTKKPALGKGLSALMRESDEPVFASSKFNMGEIPLEAISRNPMQPREEFDEDKLLRLSLSLKDYGLIQPVTVKRIDENHYQLISGERRWRASKMAEMQTIPAYIIEADEIQSLELALVENIQRQDLNALEIATSYQRLVDECNLTQEELAQKVSQKRSTITNYLRLLKLPPQIQLALKADQISMGHARALINLESEDEKIKIFEIILKDNLSVRKVEELVRKANTHEKPIDIYGGTRIRASSKKETHLYLSNKLNTLVTIQKDKKGGGQLHIQFRNEEILKKIIDFFR